MGEMEKLIPVTPEEAAEAVGKANCMLGAFLWIFRTRCERILAERYPRYAADQDSFSTLSLAAVYMAGKMAGQRTRKRNVKKEAAK